MSFEGRWRLGDVVCLVVLFGFRAHGQILGRSILGIGGEFKGAEHLQVIYIYIYIYLFPCFLKPITVHPAMGHVCAFDGLS